MYLTVDDVQLIYPGMTDADAQRLIDIVTMAFDVHRCVDVPTSPVPPEVVYGLLLWITAIDSASPTAAAVASERIGDYSYTVTGADTSTDVMTGVPPAAAGYLSDYLCPQYLEAQEVYELTIWPTEHTNDVIYTAYGQPFPFRTFAEGAWRR